MRFRTNKIGLMADIEKTFPQVSLQCPDCDVTRYLWSKNINQPPSPNNSEVYRFTRVPLGIISFQFQLIASIVQHLEGKQTLIALQIENKTCLLE